MNELRDTYPAGVPCWVDAVHDDPAAAAAFYGGVLGWDMEDALPPDAGAHYFVARVDGNAVAAVGSRPEQLPARAAWNTYVAVDDAEAAAARATELGGTVVREATLLEVIAREEPPQAEGYLASVAGRLRKAGLTYHPRVESGDPAQAILAVAGETRLVVMATRGRTGLTRWPLGSVADRVAHSGEVSVWLVRAEWQPNSQ